jgi:transcriptional regulator with XRE-family HTH domain
MIGFWVRFNELKPTKDTQESIAGRIGISKNTLYNWISKGQYPRASEATLLARELNTTVEYLVTGSDNSGINQEDLRFLAEFRQLTPNDKEEIVEIIRIKNAKRDKSSDKSADKQVKDGGSRRTQGKGA